MRALAIDEFTFKVYMDRGEVGNAVCVCELPRGKRLNEEAVERALEHTRCNSCGITTRVAFSKIICEIPLDPDDESVEAQMLHIKATAEGILSGAVDYLASLDFNMIVDSGPPLDQEAEYHALRLSR